MINNNASNDFNDSVRAYYRNLKKYTPIKDKEEERKLLREAKSGNITSRNKLIEAHLKFVFDVAKGYRGKGVSMGDLISAGNDGVITAIDKFNMDNETKFITYAVFWIRERIISAIENTGKQTYSERYIEDIIHPNMTKKDVMNIAISSDDDERVSKLDTIFPDYGTKTYDPRLNEIDSLMGTLSKKEKDVISSFYGIGCAPMSLKKLSSSMKISAERVRQIKLSGIRKMRTYALLAKNSEVFF